MKVRKTFGMALVVLAFSSMAMAGGDEMAAPSGEDVFKAHCKKCHNSFFGGLFSGAPKLGKEKHWAERLPEGVDKLTQNSIDGEGEMDPRGGCDDCTDAEIRAAVEYMVEQVQ